MIKAIIRSVLTKEEKRLGASLDYVRHVLDHSFGAFRTFSKMLPFTRYRDALPAAPYHVARLAAAHHEDCGTCVLIEINLAKQGGVPREAIRAVIDKNPEALDENLATVFRFTEGVITASGDEDQHREALREIYGERALIELAFAISAARIFPIIKRALGYATACRNVNLDV